MDRRLHGIIRLGLVLLVVLTGQMVMKYIIGYRVGTDERLMFVAFWLTVLVLAVATSIAERQDK